MCYVCRGPANRPYTRCTNCEKHLCAAGGRTADVVVPISYAIKGEQHAFNLASYKRHPGSGVVRADLLLLLQVFLIDHGRCILRAAGMPTFDAVAVVPSTRGRPGPHPLQALVGERLRLPWLPMAANPAISPESRSFHADRFSVPHGSPITLDGAAVLLLDDTWTTGSRVQSAAYALKEAGVASVAAVLLGRHANPGWEPWRPLITAVRKSGFDLDRCAVHADDPGRTGSAPAT